jgi:hypothetical protein
MLWLYESFFPVVWIVCPQFFVQITIWTGCRGCTRPHINRICRCGRALYLNSNR